MDFGFMTVAAPASQPVPLTDAPGSPGVSKDAAAAFDAALAATLGPVDGQLTPAAGAGATIAQPAWLLAQFLAPAVTASDSATTTATITEETAEAGLDAILADADSGDESSDEVDALAAVLVVPVPVSTEIKTPVVPQGGPVVDGGIGARGEQATMTQTGPPAGIEGAVRTVRMPADGVLGDAPATPANTPVAEKTPAHAFAPSATANPLVASADIAAATVSVDPTTTPAEPSVSGDALAGIAAGVRETPIVATQQMPRPETAEARAQPALEQAAAAPAIANAIAAVADQAAPAANTTAAASRTEAGESGAAVRQAVSWQAHAGNDAPMTGQDQQGQGQGRPSPEFARFAAALAQVTSAGAEDAGRATGPVVAPAAPAAPPAAAPAHATAATAAAAPQTAAQTPEAESLGRLVQAMRVISRPGAWEANVRLKPEHLGDVNIAVRVERNTVSAVVHAEAAGVRQWLESQEQAVRSGMAEHGLHLERFVVQRDGQRRDAEPQQQRQESRRQSPRRQQTTERFEIVV
jgi:flagellar hook-length control protein FliK